MSCEIFITKEHYSAVKKLNRYYTLTFGYIKKIMLSEISKTEKNTYCMVSFETSEGVGKIMMILLIHNRNWGLCTR